MKFSTFIKSMINGQFLLMVKLLKTSNEFYRASFISTAISNGIYNILNEGSVEFDTLCQKMGISNAERFKSWLELGVSLGEIKRLGSKYKIKGKLSKALMKPDNDAYNALLEEIVKYHYAFVTNANDKNGNQEALSVGETPAELIARSSRLSEPFIYEVVDAVVPNKGDFHLLEVGCGSGIYIQRACARNPQLKSCGLELDEKVANSARSNIEEWGLENRVTIKNMDIRHHVNNLKFDLVTLHQNIYYFPTEDREQLFAHLMKFLKPQGKILITSACQGGSPGLQALNIWLSAIEEYGPLPIPDQLCQQLTNAGFTKVVKKQLVPFESFWAFVATKVV